MHYLFIREKNMHEKSPKSRRDLTKYVASVKQEVEPSCSEIVEKDTSTSQRVSLSCAINLLDA